MKPFNILPLKSELLENLDSLGFKQMTPIQAESLPLVLDGKDITAQAKTGSGKTAAFGLCLLSKVDTSRKTIQALVLCPTRELADQVAVELRRLGRQLKNLKILTLCGGTPMGPQIGSLEHGAHIVVGTPGRIEDHLTRRTLFVQSINTLVLDEADRMLDMGFADVMARIIKKTPQNRQTLLFSATFPENIKTLSKNYQKNANFVKVDLDHEAQNIEQQFFDVSKEQKNYLLEVVLSHYKPESTVVFCNTKIACDEVTEDLKKRGFVATQLHGDLDQRQRDDVLNLFANKSISVLVATDVAARGLDINDLNAVINFELTRDPEVHVHRVGRTGRAGKKGLAISFCSPREKRHLTAIGEYQKIDIKMKQPEQLAHDRNHKLMPPMTTLTIDGGKKHKLRPTDILGALTSCKTFSGNDIGKIKINPFHTFVAVKREKSEQILLKMQQTPIKKHSFRVRRTL